MANKFDKQLERMEYLMGYRMPTNESKNSNVSYSAEAADGKRYGIIKEGTKYYIKVCKDATKPNLAESYDYIHGITAKKENEYKSYNEATKHFELKFMSLNESHNGHVSTSTVDFKRGEKTLAHLTEEARKELDRMHAIFENSMTIGMKNTGNPEAPKTATFAPSIGHPFEEKAEAKLDKDLKATATKPEAQGNPFDKEEKVSDADLESDKAPKGCESCKDYEDAKYVPADAVAAKKPAGGKVVRVNESFAEESINEIADDESLETLLQNDENEPDYSLMHDFYNDENDVEGEPEILGTDDVEGEPEFEYTDDENFDDLDPELDDMFDDDEFPEHESDYKFSERIAARESKSYSLNHIVECVCNNLIKSTKRPEKKPVAESFESMLGRIIKEEVSNLNVFGKHPGYRKEPMTTPSDNEVIKTTGDKDWNHDSVKGKKPFGSKIGSSAPYTEKVVDVITDAVVASVKESLKKK